MKYPELVPTLVFDENGAPATTLSEVKDDATTDGVTPQERAHNRNTASIFATVPTLGSLTIGIRMICIHIFNLMNSSLEVGDAK